MVDPDLCFFFMMHQSFEHFTVAKLPTQHANNQQVCFVSPELSPPILWAHVGIILVKFKKVKKQQQL